MKIFLPIVFISFCITLVSCSSAYKSTQTPDDLYYSPAKPKVVEENDVKSEEETKTERENNFLEQKVRNRNRWSNLDDYSYWNDTRYNHCQCFCNNTNQFNNWNTYYNGWNNPFNNWYINNNFNNPYTIFVPYNTPAVVKPFKTSGTNVVAYNNPTYNNNNFTFSPKKLNSQPVNKLNKTTSNNGGAYNNPIRTFSGSTSSGSTPSTSTPSSNTGGKSGGYNSSGSSSSTPRKGRG